MLSKVGVMVVGRLRTSNSFLLIATTLNLTFQKFSSLAFVPSSLKVRQYPPLVPPSLWIMPKPPSQPRRSSSRKRTIGTATKKSTSPSIAASSSAATSTTADEPRYFLLKQEPDEFSIDDLQHRCPHQQSVWDGIRNFRARNILRTMKVGDLAFFYHSSCHPPGIVGTMKVIGTVEPDPTAWDPSHALYDPKSTGPDNCRWDRIHVQFQERYPVMITLHELKALAVKEYPILADMTLLRVSRLSVHEVTKEQWMLIEELVAKKASGQVIMPSTSTMKMTESTNEKVEPTKGSTQKKKDTKKRTQTTPASAKGTTKASSSSSKKDTISSSSKKRKTRG